MSDKSTVVAIGAALSANKGAASMLMALVDHIDEIIPGGRVVSLSTHPVADRAVNRSDRLVIGSMTPLQIVTIVFPMALLIGLLRSLGLSGRSLALTASLRQLMDAAVVADLAGISFADGRGFPTLAYNTLMTGIPVLVGARVVKCAQALGPFEDLSTRTAARLVLPRLDGIVARGAETSSHLSALGLSNVTDGSDLAFLMQVGPEQHAEAARLLDRVNDGFVVVSPSSVVRSLSEARGIDYVAFFSDMTQSIVTRMDRDVVIVAHSAQPGRPEGRMNDLPVCAEVFQRLRDTNRVHLIDESLDPAVLRSVIDRSAALLASRFHAMVSGLATATPTVVIGWSHKYHEVMLEFGLEDYVVPYQEFHPESVVDLVEASMTNEVSARIAEQLPRVLSQSRRSIELLKDSRL